MRIRVRPLMLSDFEIEIPNNAKLADLRPLVAEQLNLDAPSLRFIFHGRVLADKDVLKERGIVEGMTILVVTGRPHGAAENAEAGTPQLMNTFTSQINIRRADYLEDPQSAVALVRQTFDQYIVPISRNLAYEASYQENSPEEGDITVTVRLTGNEVRHPNSSARSRVNHVYSMLGRAQIAMNIIKADLCGLIREIMERRYEVDGAHFRRLDEAVLRLEETLVIPQACPFYAATADYPVITERAHPVSTIPVSATSSSVSSTSTSTVTSPTVPAVPSGTAASLGRPASAPEIIRRDDAIASTNITQHSTRGSYIMLLDHLVLVQNGFIEQIRDYQTIMRNAELFCADEYTRSLSYVFQEYVRRILHLFGHAFHTVSDLSTSFESLELDELRPTEPEMANPYRTEGILHIHCIRGDDATIQARTEALQSFMAQTSEISRVNQQQRSFSGIQMQFIGDLQFGRGFLNAPNPTAGASAGAPTGVPAGTRFATNQQFFQFPPFSSGRAAPGNASLQRFPTPQTAIRRVAPSQLAGVPQTAIRRVPPQLAGAPQTAIRHGASPQASFISRPIPLFRAEAMWNVPTMGPVPRAIPPGVVQFPFTIPPVTLQPTAATSTSSVAQTVTSNNAAATGSGTVPGRSLGSPMGMPMGHGVHTLHGMQFPGMFGQVVVEADDPESARHVLNATMQAANSTWGAGTAFVGSQPPENAGADVGAFVPPEGQPGRIQQQANALSQFFAQTAQHNPPSASLFSGNHLASTDRYLRCRSFFAHPSADLHNSSDYSGAVHCIRESAMRYGKSLPVGSRLRREISGVTDRWDALIENDRKQYQDNTRGRRTASVVTPMQPTSEDFKKNVATVFERLLYEMASTDPDIAEDLEVSRDDQSAHFMAITGRRWRAEEEASISAPEPAAAPGDQAAASADQAGASFEAFHRGVSGLYALGTFGSAGSEVNFYQRAQMFRVLTDIVNSFEGTTSAHFLRRAGFLCQAGRGFFNLMFSMCFEVLDNWELVRLLAGNVTNLNHYRQPARRFIIERILNNNSHPSAEDLDRVVQRLQITESSIDSVFRIHGIFRMAVDIRGIGRIDIPASILNIDRNFIRAVLILFLDDSDSLSSYDFTNKLIEVSTNYFHRFFTLTSLASINPEGYSLILMLLAVENFGERREGNQSDGDEEAQRQREENLLFTEFLIKTIQRYETSYSGPAFTVAGMVDELVLLDPIDDDISWSSDSAETIISTGSYVEETEKGSDAGTVKNEGTDNPSTSQFEGTDNSSISYFEGTDNPSSSQFEGTDNPSSSQFDNSIMRRLLLQASTSSTSSGVENQAAASSSQANNEAVKLAHVADENMQNASDAREENDSMSMEVDHNGLDVEADYSNELP